MERSEKIIKNKKLFLKSLLTICVVGVTLICVSENEHKVNDKKEPIRIAKEFKKISAKEEKCKVNIESPAKKTVYLTFDDGPNIYTDQILDILEKENVKSTFFVIGSQIPLYKNQLKDVINECHTVATHSMTHLPNKLYNHQDPTFVYETIQLKEILKKEFNYETNLSRAPYGSTYLNAKLVDELKKNDLKLWDWTIDSMDWQYGPGQYQQIIANINQQLGTNGEKYKEEIILMHERESTVKALPFIIKMLREKGFTFKSYDEKQHLPHNFKLDNEL